jgi:uncharacterized protein (DUF58 family)
LTWSPTLRLLALGGVWLVAALASLLSPFPGMWLAAGACLLAAAVAADWLISRRDPPLLLERRLPERAYVGSACPVALEVRNPGMRPAAVRVYEAAPEDLRPSQLDLGACSVPAGAAVDLGYELRPRRRGDRPLGAALAFAGSALGLLRRRVEAGAGECLRVYPEVAHLLRPEALDPRRFAEQLGARPVRRRGEGVEFESLRDYVPGDDPRRLDWAASARRGRPVVRHYQHERNHTVAIALDASRLMAAEVEGRSKLDHAVDAALALAHAALVSGDRVSLAVFDREVRGFLAPRRHRREIGQLVDFLRPVQPRLVEADFRSLAREIAVRQRQRALVVVLTDFVETEAASLEGALAVVGRSHRVLLVALRDPLYAGLDPRAPAPGGSAEELHRRLVLGDLLREREATLLGLRRAGLHTLDLAPRELTARVLNRYLQFRFGPER